MTDYLILVPLAYLLGSVPFGLIAGRLVANVDIRDYGSGKIGMTNVLRTSGKMAAALVLILTAAPRRDVYERLRRRLG